MSRFILVYICCMNDYLDPEKNEVNEFDQDLEKRLRPLRFDDFTGQDQALSNLKIFVEAANFSSIHRHSLK